MKKLAVAILVGALTAGTALAGAADDILAGAGLTGGLVVHVGCGEGGLTAALGEGASFIVQGLDASADNVAAARQAINAKGLYGRVTARTFDGRSLPYRDNTVNLVVVTAADCAVPNAEIMRVLAPQGVAIVNGKKQVKPRPAEIDDWTHYHHDPQGTMVGLDKAVAPLHGIQWVGAPKWLRNHDFMTVMHAMVTTNGRVFYVIDEGLRNHILLPSKWVLVARDAFNGAILWKKPLKDWHPQNYPLKSGPAQFARRLVAVGDRVYLTFGQTEPLSVVDAVTGKTIRTYEDTKATEEIVLDDGVLYLLVNPNRKKVDYTVKSTGYGEIRRANSGWAWSAAGPPESVMAVDAESGKTIWRHESKVAPFSLTLGGGKVYFNNGAGCVALDRKTGEKAWTSTGPAIKSVPTGGSVRSVFSDGVLAVSVGTNATGIAAKTGKQLWTGKLLPSSHHCPNDMFVIDGLIWSARTGTGQRTGTTIWARDLHTGELKKDFKATNLPAFPMHPRCYPGRATTQYLMLNGMGAEFHKLGETTVEINHAVRGSCIYGVMPANGLLYKPPDTCACYYQSKLEYFCALSAKSALKKMTPEPARLEKGPAYAKPNPQSEIRNPQSDWPMYRRDPARSGSTASTVDGKLTSKWTVKLGGKLTQPVVAGGKAFVSSIDSQTIFAIDTDSGKVAWTFIADGKVDSAPTLYKGTVLFGCADGRVYCLRAADGTLAWRYLVAPSDTQIVSYQQVESVWPVHGAVLVVNDALYALAGRNMFFDGGMRLVRLDPTTGKMTAENMMDENDPATGKNLQTLIDAKYMPIANPDIFSSDGKRVYMQEQNFTLEGKRLNIAPTQPGKTGPDGPGGRHLFCQTGLLDDAWFHRSFWVYGDNCGEGWAAYARTRQGSPCGRIMAFGEKKIYGYRSTPLGNMLLPRTTYALYAADKDPVVVEAAPQPQPAPEAAPKKPRGKRKAKAAGAASPAAAAKPDPAAKAAAKAARRGKDAAGRKATFKEDWQCETPGMLVNAMVLATDRLFIAGPPDVADETKMLGYNPGANDDVNRQLKAQADAWLGRSGGLLRAVSLDEGKTLIECKLDSVPIFDGMSAAEGKLFISLKNGSVTCFGEK